MATALQCHAFPRVAVFQGIEHAPAHAFFFDAINNKISKVQQESIRASAYGGSAISVIVQFNRKA
jgi:hypothetical protein